MQFSQTFKTLCKERGVTQQQALIDMGLSRSSTQKWAQGTPTAPALKKIAAYFGVSTDELLGLEQKKPATNEGNGLSQKKAELLKRVMQMSDDELQKLELLLQIVGAK